VLLSEFFNLTLNLAIQIEENHKYEEIKTRSSGGNITAKAMERSVHIQKTGVIYNNPDFLLKMVFFGLLFLKNTKNFEIQFFIYL
jgi:hypothetical protein